MRRPGIADVHKGYYTFKVNYQMFRCALPFSVVPGSGNEGMNEGMNLTDLRE